MRKGFWLLVVLAVLAAVLAGPASVRWKLVSETPTTLLGNGATHVTKKLKGRIDLELSLVFFDSRTAQLSVVAQSTTDRSMAQTLAELASEAGAVAACNGGYFHRDFSPSGLEIARGVRTGAWQEGLPFGGVLYVSKDGAVIASDEAFKLDGTVTDLVQCCPMLVQKSAALHGTGGPEQVARTFIATDGGHRWLIGFTPRASYEHLASALTDPEVMHEFTVQSALNLDGGPSSSLWWLPANGKAQGIHSTATVRNIIAILPKKP